MATTTGLALIQALSEEIGDYETATSSGSGSTTSIVSTGLQDLIGGTSNDFCINQYVHITSGDATGEIRQVSSYNASSTTIGVNKAFSATIAGSVTFVLHRYDPIVKRAAINHAIERLYPILYLPVEDDWSIIVDDLLTDTSFEGTPSGNTFPAWTNSGGASVTAETSRVFHGAQSANINPASSSVVQQYQQPTVNVHEVIGKTATFQMRVWATAASEARIRLDWDGSNFENSDYHSGNEQWELLTAEGTVPSTATRIRVICEVAANGSAAYFDAGGDCGLYIDPIYEYTMPTTLNDPPSRVEMQVNANEPKGPFRFLQKGNLPIRGRHLRLVGKGLLSRPSTDTATTEVGEPQVRLIVYKAMEIFWSMYASPARSAMSDRVDYLRAAQDAERQFDKLMFTNPAIASDAVGAKKRDGVWHTRGDSTSRYLVLDSHAGGVFL
jgi:hypothetical protein